jgi:outer membrane protein insertion porin family
MSITRVRRSALLTAALLTGFCALAPQAIAQAPEPPPLTGVQNPNTPSPAPDKPATPAPAAARSAAPVSTAPEPGPASVAPPIQSTVVKRIVVEGNERIETATIESYLPIASGDTVDSAKLDLALKTLYRTNLFSDVRLDIQGDTLLVRVSENPIINQVLFEGNSALSSDKIKDEVEIHPRSIFTRSKVLEDVQRIVELYRRSGRISVVVTPKIVELPQKRVDLVFEISEGPKTGILRVNFLGNKEFGDATLRDVVVTKESAWYKFFASNDNFDPDRIEYDREQLRKYYTNKGYYDFRVVSSVAELTPNQRSFAVTYTMDEGSKYKFGKLTIKTDLKKLNANILQLILPIKEGQLYRSDKIESAVDTLTFAAGAAGFAFVDIRPRYTANRQTHTVDVVFEIKEGPRVYVERIDIVGNTQTLDPVIRQELRLAEGDAYNRVLVDRSKNELKRLGFFKTVDITQIPGSAPDKTILQVKVQEQPTGELSFGAGYSSIDRLLLNVGITQRNFRGTGADVRIRADVGSLRQQIDFSYTEPRFNGRDLRVGYDIGYYRFDYTDTSGFDSGSYFAKVRAGFPLNLNTYFEARYGISENSVTVSDSSCAAGVISVVICDQRGNSLSSAVGYTLSLDRRNDPIHPTRGFVMTLNQDFAGLGGDVRYLQTKVLASTYYGFSPAWVLEVKGDAGYIGGWGNDNIRINNRFFEGGDSFPGFQIAGIGPRDTNPSFQEALGGNLYAIGTVQLSLPNGLPEQYGIKTALFTDVGTLGLVDKDVKAGQPTVKDDLGIRASTGLSVFWTSPLGPIRLDFSQVLAKESYDKTEAFRFSTNTQFQ